MAVPLATSFANCPTTASPTDAQDAESPRQAGLEGLARQDHFSKPSRRVALEIAEGPRCDDPFSGSQDSGGGLAAASGEAPRRPMWQVAALWLTTHARNCRTAVAGSLLVDKANRCCSRDDFGLDELNKEPVMLVLACWHSYALWMYVCAAVTVAGNLLLQWYIEWYRESLRRGAQQFPYRLYFAVFLRSWATVALFSEGVRFCYILILDVWSKDTFGRYRRALCGLAYLDMAVDPSQKDPVMVSLPGMRAAPWSVWPHFMVDSRRRFVDFGVQLLLYFSLDILPLLVGIVTCARHDMMVALREVGLTLLAVSSAHVTLFFVAWTITDVSLKVIAARTILERAYAGRRASRASRRWSTNRSADGVPLAGAPVVAPKVVARPQMAADAAARGTSCSPMRSGSVGLVGAAVGLLGPLSDAHQGGHACKGARNPRDDRQWEALTRGSVSTAVTVLGKTTEDRLHCCMPCCAWSVLVRFEVVFHVTWIGILLVGATRSVHALFSALGVVATMWYVRTCKRWRGPKYLQVHCAWFAEGWIKLARLRALENWGRIHCRLDYDSQTNAYLVFAIIVVMQAYMFSMFKQTAGLIVCTLLTLMVICRFQTMRMVKPCGWAVSLVEGVVITLVTVAVNGVYGYGWFSFFISLLRQFGLARRHPSGNRIVFIVRVVLHIVLVIVVWAVLYADRALGKEERTFTWLCNETGDGTCIYFDVNPEPLGDTLNETLGIGVACEYRSTGPGTMLSLSDFGLFAAIAYEGRSTLNDSLEHFFPGWRLDFARYAADSRNSQALEKDWTTFYEFTDPSNSTTVFAIRGTSEAVEVLNDVTIWLPAVIMQMFGIVGPVLAIGMGEAVAWLCNAVQGSEHGRDFFQMLLERVEQRVSTKDRKRYFLTGHSLGGGLAKLVASQVKIPAVTFASPGVGLTRYIVFVDQGKDELHFDGLTLVPDNDIVSRIDSQAGLVMRTPCDGNALQCHDVFPIVCAIVETCGSGRAEGEEKLRLPCGRCPGERWACPESGGVT